MTSPGNGLPESPYRGLEPYRFCDRAIFFEREAETERLSRLTTMYRGALLYGESGAGKSSLINAGLIPRLIDEGTIVERLRVQPRRGREMVVERISRSGRGSDFLPSVLAGGPEDGATVISAQEFPDRVRATSATKLLLIFDQFEELLTLTSEALEDSAASDSQHRILDSIVGLLQDRKIHHARFLFVFREEYLAKFERFFYFCPDLPDQFLRLTPPRANALRRLIRGPFESENIPKGHWKRELSEDVASALEKKLRPAEDGTPINLSQVQIVLRQLWKSKTPASLLDLRGVEGLVSDYLRDELETFQEDQPTAETLLSLMITVNGTRKVLEAAELVEQARRLKVSPEETETTIEKLVSETRLVRRDYNRGATTYEVVSEFLVPWIRALKLRRAARDIRIFWMRRAVGLAGILAIVLTAVFMVQYERTRAEAQKNSLVKEAHQKQAMAESNEAIAQKELKKTLDAISDDNGAEFRSLTDQLKSSIDAANKARALGQELALQLTAVKAQADKYSSDLATANQDLSHANTLLYAQTKIANGLQDRLDVLEKAPKPPAQNSANSPPASTAPKTTAAGPAPTADVSWQMGSDADVKENFGPNLSKNYYVFQIKIANTTGSAVLFQCRGFKDKEGNVFSPTAPEILAPGLTSSQLELLYSLVTNELVVPNNTAKSTAVFIPKAVIPKGPVLLTPVFATTPLPAPQFTGRPTNGPAGTATQKR